MAVIVHDKTTGNVAVIVVGADAVVVAVPSSC